MEGVARGLLNLFRELQNYVATAEAAAFKRRERAFGRLLFRGGALWETKCPRLLKIGYEFFSSPWIWDITELETICRFYKLHLSNPDGLRNGRECTSIFSWRGQFLKEPQDECQHFRPPGDTHPFLQVSRLLLPACHAFIFPLKSPTTLITKKTPTDIHYNSGWNVINIQGTPKEVTGN